ncbi:MAG: D-alanine--D-alanine ligase [Clostridiales bacterium]|nr:D-alanine--D-alanine ligase [Clostridiales bacterium]
MKIVVLAGGISPERDVSLCSASLISNALLSKGHQVAFVDVYEGIPDFEKKTEADLTALFEKPDSGKTFSYSISAKEPDLEALIASHGGRRELIGPGVLDLCRKADAVFIACHGGMGENGRLQAALDCIHVPYTGSGYLSCALAMDKHLSKTLLRHFSIPTVDWILFDPEKDTLDVVYEKIGFPCVVKPIGCGSSCGVSIVHDESEWEAAITYSTKYEKTCLIEKMVKGREFSIGILDGQALPIIEIIPKQGFYDYKNKYQANSTEEICPAALSEEKTKEAQGYALAVHRALGLGNYSRVDFILSEEDDTFYALEANNLPGMTPNSLLPQEARAIGISYEDLCEKLVLSASIKD